MIQHGDGMATLPKDESSAHGQIRDFRGGTDACAPSQRRRLASATIRDRCTAGSADFPDVRGALVIPPRSVEA
jgi:hypothetical protein